MNSRSQLGNILNINTYSPPYVKPSFITKSLSLYTEIPKGLKAIFLFKLCFNLIGTFPCKI